MLNKQLVGSDLNEAGLLKLLDEMESGIPVKVIVTVIGGQGYLSEEESAIEP